MKLATSKIPERAPTDVKCIIYQGVLSDGTSSPGFIPTYGGSRHPAAWVCSMSSFTHRQFEKNIEGEINYTDQEWADRNVRLVYVEMPRAILTITPDEYYIQVYGEFLTATQGRAIPKLGMSTVMEVPDGQTNADRERQRLIDRASPLADRMAAATNRYSTSSGNSKGPDPGLNTIQIPSPGHLWFSA